MSELDINTKWNALKKQLNDIMDSCIPNKMTTTRHNVPWTNRTLIRLTRKKQRLFNKAQKKKGNEAWSRYKSCKKQVTQQMRKARSDYVNNIIESAFQEVDTKPFYAFAFRRRRHYVFGLSVRPSVHPSVRPSVRSLKYPLLTCT